MTKSHPDDWFHMVYGRATSVYDADLQLSSTTCPLCMFPVEGMSLSSYYSMANHVASHLKAIMFLTVRLMSSMPHNAELGGDVESFCSVEAELDVSDMKERPLSSLTSLNFDLEVEDHYLTGLDEL